MKQKLICVLAIALLISCKNSLREQAISKVEEYNQELNQLAIDSTKAIDTAAINEQYYKIDIPSIPDNILTQISDESAFNDVLRKERDLLSDWSQVADFKTYQGKIPHDSIIYLIRRCSAFDRAPLNAGRLPSARGMRTISLDYYKIEVPVAFHIIQNTQGEGQLADMASKINDQITLLNSVYAKFNIKFKLISTDVTINDNWFNRASYYTDSNALYQMTQALKKDPSKTMNVYTLGSQRVLGEAAYPWFEGIGTHKDYIVINYNTLPGGPVTYLNGDYNQGKTLIHEAGHFLGLYHTFEGGDFSCNLHPPHDGCQGRGDFVEDTPSQQICYYTGCDENSDSCPAPGRDPVRNYMGYNPDACMNEFTVGQGERLLQSIINFRYYLVTNPVR